jgi:hypothetical protein
VADETKSQSGGEAFADSWGKLSTTAKWIVAVVTVLMVAGAITAAVIVASNRDRPISEQSCAELADTLADIQDRLAPGEDFDTQREATKDASELNDRVDELGGCASEPSLQ